MRVCRYSEIFYSIQGEGKYTGVPTVWVRFWGCNLNCHGFGQPDPEDPSTWSLEHLNVEVSNIEELPIFERGCDSSYSWAKKFQHLTRKGTAKDIVLKIIDTIKNEFNENGQFIHPYSKQDIHLGLTGGEPMLSQNIFGQLFEEFHEIDNSPRYVTVETNGTIPLRKRCIETIESFYRRSGKEWFWSVSPKLPSTSGEPFEKSLRPDVVTGYKEVSGYGQIKFVINGTEKSWKDVDYAMNEYLKRGIDWEVWIMPVGAREEDQRMVMEKVAMETLRRGFNLAARVHCWVFGNKVGT